MDMLLLFARLGLAAVFAVAGIAKVLDLDGSRRAMQGFGLPASLAGPAGVVLPIVEMVIALSLLPRATAWWGAIAAALLLAAFIAGITTNLLKGRTPDCHCFGQLHSEPAGKATLLRNGALAAVALWIVGFGQDDPGLSAVAWFGDLSTVEKVLVIALASQAVAIAAGGWLMFQIIGQNGRLLQRMDEIEASRTPAEKQPSAPSEAPRGLPVGTPAPAFTLDDLDGQPVSLDDLRTPGKPVIAIFTSPHCGPCTMLMPDIARWQRELADRYAISVIASGSAEANRAKAQEHGIERMLLDSGRTVARSYESSRTPAAVMIRPDGTIGSPLTGGVEAIRRLMSQLSAPTPPKVGDRAPVVSLPDLDGRTVTTSDYLGRELVMLFWRPGCGFCQRMAPDLRAWLSRRTQDDPTVILISSESVEANRAMGLDAPILLDEGFSTGRTSGARGSPSAVRIAADGTIASDVIVGAPAIMDLLASETRTSTRAAAD